MSNFYLMHVKQSFGTFKKNGVYWVDALNASKIPAKYAVLYPSELIEKYKEHPNLLLVRSGGIGDLIALTVLCGIDGVNTVILTQDKYKPLARYINYAHTFKGFSEPIFTVKFPNTVEDECKKWGQMVGDTEIDKGSKRNWFKILNESAGFTEYDEESLRPDLLSKTNVHDNVCIAVSTASCVNRSADREMLKQIAQRHFENVVMADEQDWTLSQYLEKLDRAKFVISVDTSAIHFREGIGKPALGIYGAFTTESRTKYYQFTKSIDVVSLCPLQPCFKHDSEICPHLNGLNYAPCLGRERDVVEHQIETALIQYLKTL